MPEAISRKWDFSNNPRENAPIAKSLFLRTDLQRQFGEQENKRPATFSIIP
jgi:hypothetical protein